MIKKIRNAPGWLGLTEDRTQFVFLEDRAEIVRQIFDMSIAGFGGYTIAKLLNSRKVPPFGKSKSWDQSTIHNMLSSRATLGEYQKKETVEGKEIPVGEPIPDYYPPVIDITKFEAAQAARISNLSTGRGRKGRFFANVFSDLPKCTYCGSPVKFHANGAYKSLICSTVLDDGDCFRFGWSYSDFEDSFFEFLERQPYIYPQFSAQLQQLRACRKNDEEEIYQIRAAIAQVLKSVILELSVTSAGAAPPQRGSDETVRRNHSERCFEALFSDGSRRRGYPAPKKNLLPLLNLDPALLSKTLGISPRQGSLTALLAQGDSLVAVSEQLGMTVNTARWHLREVFRRTKTNSQVELRNLAERACAPAAAESD